MFVQPRHLYRCVAKSLNAIVLTVLCLLVILSNTTAVTAQENFSTSSTVLYSVANDGSTRVSHTFKITNLSPTTYLSQHTLKLSYPDLSSISATTQGSAVEPYVVNEGNATSITLNFDDSVVGEGQTRDFTISYSTSDIANRLGNVLEVRVPQLSGSDTFKSHQIKIGIPSEFGQPVRANPEPDLVKEEPTQTVFTYNTTGQQGISLQFGSEQFYRVSTVYPLRNEASSPAFGQITLPPDTSYQRVEYRVLEPLPTSLKSDIDGNWIATYVVPPNEELLVRLEADVRLSLEPDKSVPIPIPTAAHTTEREYWETTNPALAQLFGEASVETIYQQVIDTLTYDEERVKRGELMNRLGAVGAIMQPTQAVCQEYADLAIAGWRRAGIPARRLNGYAYTTNQTTRPLSFAGTVLHAWPEYFDAQTGLWKMVDPTWQDTTGGVDYFNQFDLNHIVFSIYGISSTEPFPAGSYANDEDQTTLSVAVTDDYASSDPNISVTLTPKLIGSIEIPGQYDLVLTNTTGRAWYTIQLDIATEGIEVEPKLQPVHLLPFEKKIIPLRAVSPLQAGIVSADANISIQPVAQEATTHNVKLTAAPRIIEKISSVNTTTPVGGIALITLLAAGSILVFRRKRKPALRRKSQKSQASSVELPTVQSSQSENQTDGSQGENS